MGLYVKDGGAWVELGDTKFRAKDGGAWVTPNKVYAKDGGAWVEVWPSGGGGTTPVTYTFVPTDSDSYRETNKWRGISSGIYQCSWDFGDHIGILAFDFDDIIAKCGGKTFDSASLRLTRDAGGGGSNSPILWAAAASTINDSYQVITTSGKPNLIDGTRDELSGTLSIGATGTFDIPETFITRLLNGTSRGFGFATSETLQGTSTGGGGQKACYANYHPANAGSTVRPRLQITVLE